MKNIPILADGVTLTKIGDENILFPNYLNETQIQIASLNEVGYSIMTKINGQKSLNGLAKEFAEEYQIDFSIALSDIIEFLNKMEEKKIIYFTDEVGEKNG